MGGQRFRSRLHRTRARGRAVTNLQKCTEMVPFRPAAELTLAWAGFVRLDYVPKGARAGFRQLEGAYSTRLMLDQERPEALSAS